MLLQKLKEQKYSKLKHCKTPFRPNLKYKNWKKNVYDKVEDNGQYCISVRWVIKPKLINRKLQTKASLCAWGGSLFQIDSPTCMQESV